MKELLKLIWELVFIEMKNGLAPVLNLLRMLKKLLFKIEKAKSYKTPAGNSKYCKNILEFSSWKGNY